MQENVRQTSQPGTFSLNEIYTAVCTNMHRMTPSMNHHLCDWSKNKSLTVRTVFQVDCQFVKLISARDGTVVSSIKRIDIIYSSLKRLAIVSWHSFAFVGTFTIESWLEISFLTAAFHGTFSLLRSLPASCSRPSSSYLQKLICPFLSFYDRIGNFQSHVRLLDSNLVSHADPKMMRYLLRSHGKQLVILSWGLMSLENIF